MEKYITYPGLYIAGDPDTRSIVPKLCAQGYYVIMLRGRSSENETIFGGRYYDFRDATLVCHRSGFPLPTIYTETLQNCQWLVAFRPELFEQTPREKEISDYPFFSYRPEEALHLSVEEIKVITGCIRDICLELRHPIDHYSGVILAKHIVRILDYITRFYDRQFITRELAIEKIIARYDKMLEQYMKTGRLYTQGLPTAKYYADRLLLSEAYFHDILRHKTGRTHDSYVQTKRIEMAKRKLTGSNIPLRQIVATLGFPSVQYFCYIFRKLTGYAPNNYRFLN